MAAARPRSVKVQLAARLLLALVAIATATILFLSNRPVGLTDMVRIDELAALPDSERLDPVRSYTEIGSGLIPYFPGETVARRQGRPPLKLGWVYREFSALRMPFAARSEFGPVTFMELSSGRQYAMLSPEQAVLIDEAIGSRVAQGQAFAWYRHLWGWLVLLGLIGWTLLRWWESRLRDQENWGA